MAVAQCKIIRQKVSVGASTFLSLSDTPGSFTANRIIHANPAGTALVDSNVNILSTGAFLVGRTTAFSVSSVAEFGKNQNTLTAVQVINETDGNAAQAGFFTEQGSGGTLVTGSLRSFSTLLTPTAGREADSVDIGSLGASAGIVFRTEDDAPIKWKTNQILRALILGNANTFQFNAGGTVEGGAASGNNLTLSSNAIADGKVLLGISAYDEVNDRFGAGTDFPNARLDVRGVAGASVGGFASGSLHVTSSSATANANAVITGHNLFGGNKQLWYLGSVSSSNDNIAFINRQTGSLALQTSNSLVTLLTGSSNTLQGNAGLKLQGGAGIFTLTLSGGTGLASTLKLQEAITDILSAYGAAGQAQAVKIADPSGGATVDAEARAAVDKIIDVLEGIGFSAAA